MRRNRKGLPIFCLSLILALAMSLVGGSLLVQGALVQNWTRMTVWGTVAVAGVLLLAVLAFRCRCMGEASRQEVQRLREQAAAMEQKLDQNQDLAHRQRLESLGALTSSISHEFNNLLTPIMGYSLMILEKLPPEDESIYDDVLEIYNASRKAKTIVSRLSDLSRKNSTLTFQYLAPGELIQRTLDVARPALPQNVTLQTRTDCRNLWIYGNETQLLQLLLNLVLNAFQAAERTDGTVSISAGEEGEQVVFRVSDTGEGIPPELVDKIFEPFFTTKEAGKGTGLGLAIAREVAEQNGGTVTVTSAPGAGAVFTAAFPKAGGEESE